MVDAWNSRDDGVSLTGHPGVSSSQVAGVHPGCVLPDGWGDHRRRVRRRGAFAALMLPAMAGVAAAILLWSGAGGWSGLTGLALAVAAAPLLPMAGVPATADPSRVMVGGTASAVLWLVLGAVAARRATRTPGASWPEWRRDYTRLALGAVVGGWASLLLAAMVVGVRLR